MKINCMINHKDMKSVYAIILAGAKISGAAVGVPDEDVNKIMDFIKDGFGISDYLAFLIAYWEYTERLPLLDKAFSVVLAGLKIAGLAVGIPPKNTSKMLEYVKKGFSDSVTDHFIEEITAFEALMESIINNS